MCAYGVHGVEGNRHGVSLKKCTACGYCVKACPASTAAGGALRLAGSEARPDQLYKRLAPQLRLLRKIGGLTVSGGEPLLQREDLAELLTICSGEGVHTAVETSGTLGEDAFDGLLDLVDCWLYGLRPVPKAVDRGMHAAWLRQERNLRYIRANSEAEVVLRVPLIPGMTTSRDSLQQVVGVARAGGVRRLELLPFNPHTGHYYAAMGLEAPAIRKTTKKELARSEAFFISNGLDVKALDRT